MRDLRIAAGVRHAVRAMRLWRERQRRRAELARLGGAMLRDIGVLPHQAGLEAGKPFWRP